MVADWHDFSRQAEIFARFSPRADIVDEVAPFLTTSREVFARFLPLDEVVADVEFLPRVTIPEVLAAEFVAATTGCSCGDLSYHRGSLLARCRIRCDDQWEFAATCVRLAGMVPDIGGTGIRFTGMTTCLF